jgi:hypothetical protein
VATIVAFHAHPDDEVLLTGGTIAAILGADQAVHLGYADSGHGPVLFDDPPGRTRFVRADLEEAAGKLAALLTEVHAVGARAAGLAGVRVVEATVPRELGARGQDAPPAGQVALAGVPHRHGDGVVRRARRTDG